MHIFGASFQLPTKHNLKNKTRRNFNENKTKFLRNINELLDVSYKNMKELSLCLSNTSNRSVRFFLSTNNRN